MEAVAVRQPFAGTTHLAARSTIAGSATFVLLLAALHAIKPELDPSWRFISEYAIGEHGWLMVLAFFVLALSHISLAVAVRSELRSTGGRIALALLLVSAAGLVIAGLFTTDPITASPEAATMQGNLHAIGGAMGMAMPFAALLVSWKLGRAWRSNRRMLWAAAGLAFAGFLTSFISLGWMLSESNGAFGPEVLVGWPNRIEILTHCVWLMVVGSCATRASST